MKKILGVIILTSLVVGGVSGCAVSKSEAPAVPQKVENKLENPVVVPKTVQTPVLDGIYSYQCELGKKVTVVYKKEESDVITLRWNNKTHQLKRTATTTGANRFEDNHAGLVWINIPAKGILLDSKKGRQLANDCKA